ncbi:MAG TPA: cytochrome C oxidase subunit I [Rhodocyclaceae bacterium]|nr:MAG: cytochrome C oxidase subunit I [Rhodocyclales bacterium CG17_big_fil_post_rev_8_21_14_2_50_68_7]PIX75702.1 MAG: cytochrome C oxidase subunit I [Rhodocyclales bacterium CG_4_10_14_3_um_filter_68_10]HCX34407.1 cytochrome C oxidase subunit I [Rhodocyclaceae bacterium]
MVSEPKQTPADSAATASERLVLLAYATTAIAVFALMMIVGFLMRSAQATWVDLPVDRFYELMTLHGTGMVGTAGLGGAFVMWYFLGRHVRLSSKVMLTTFGLSLAGVVLIIGGILLGHYAGAWTFLYPLPAKSMGVWQPAAAAAFVVGLILIGVGFLLFYADCALALIRRYGSLTASLGVPQLISGRVEEAPPAAVVASTMAIIVNVLGILAGAVVLIMTLVSLYIPGMVFDALLMKNLIFFFGHVFINVALYMGVIAVYEILPRYTNRPWKVNRPFIAAWLAAVFLVLAVYPHHLLMDYAMPKWAATLGQVVSYLSGIPVLIVTAWGTLGNIARSGIRWDLPSRLLVFGVLGWAAGIVPAVVDGTISVNLVMHNTQWVPGHFHTYLLLGLLPMLLGFMAWAVQLRGEDSSFQRAAFWGYAIAGAVFCLSFLYGGANGVPRRFAVHVSEWLPVASVGSIAAAVVVVSVVSLALVIVRRLPQLGKTVG